MPGRGAFCSYSEIKVRHIAPVYSTWQYARVDGMPSGNPVSNIGFYFLPQPPGQRANRWVIAAISLLLLAVVAGLWLYIYYQSLDKPYIELKGYRVPSQENVEQFLRQGNNRERFTRMQDYFARYGVADAVEPASLLRQGTDWLDIHEPAFAIAPQSQWHNMVATLALVRNELVPAIGPVTVLSAYRTASYSHKTGGTDSSKHRDFCGLDLVPQSNISRKELLEELKALQVRLGPPSNMGLGFSSDLRFHIDTCGYRSW